MTKIKISQADLLDSLQFEYVSNNKLFDSPRLGGTGGAAT